MCYVCDGQHCICVCAAVMEDGVGCKGTRMGCGGKARDAAAFCLSLLCLYILLKSFSIFSFYLMSLSGSLSLSWSTCLYLSAYPFALSLNPFPPFVSSPLPFSSSIVRSTSASSPLISSPHLSSFSPILFSRLFSAPLLSSPPLLLSSLSSRLVSSRLTSPLLSAS